MNDNESGLTLVELLAVLVLISLVSGVIWTTMSVAIKHNVLETTKLQLQQEANITITKIQREHRKLTCYEIIINKSKIELLDCDNQTSYIDIKSDKFSYGPEKNEIIEPKKEDLKLDDFYLETLDSKTKIEIPTIISRYKSEQ